MTPGTLEHDLHAALLAQASLPPVGVARPDLLDAAAKAVEAARVALVERWDRLAWKVAGKWHARNQRGQLEDYRSAAQLGLWEAARRFRPERGHQFSTYATWWIMRYVKGTAMGEASAGFHVPAHHGFVHLNPVSADAELPGDDGATFAAAIPAPEPDHREAPPDAAAVWAAVGQVLAGRPQELAVLEAVYRDGLTLKAAGERVGGVSRERVRQIAIRALGRLRDRGHVFAGFLDPEEAA